MAAGDSLTSYLTVIGMRSHGDGGGYSSTRITTARSFGRHTVSSSSLPSASSQSTHSTPRVESPNLSLPQSATLSTVKSQVAPSNTSEAGYLQRHSARPRNTSGGANSLSAMGQAVPRHLSASQSHHLNDAYMSDWDRAYTDLYGEHVKKKEGDPPHPVATVATAHAFARFTDRRPRGVSVGNSTAPLLTANSPDTDAQDRGVWGALPPPEALNEGGQIVMGCFVPPSLPPLSARWKNGPVNPAGNLIDLSDRPLLGMSIDPRSCGLRAEAVVAGSDHAAYVIDLLKGVKRRVLHGGRYGHTDWVTGVTYMGDRSDRIASCAQDGKVCLWEASSGRGVAGSARCVDLTGHFGSISAVVSPGGGSPAAGPVSARAGHLIISTGYDKSVRVWDTRVG